MLIVTNDNIEVFYSKRLWITIISKNGQIIFHLFFLNQPRRPKKIFKKNLTFLIKDAVQKMDLVERSEINELKKEIESIKKKIKTSNKN